MTNDELKKKIMDVINATDISVELLRDDIIILADALIAAGIGDVKRHRVFVSKDGKEVKQLYNGEEVEKIVKERDEYKHRAEVAERALYKACKNIKDICEYIVKIGGTGVITIKNYAPERAEPSAYIDRAEKELAEERKDD